MFFAFSPETVTLGGATRKKGGRRKEDEERKEKGGDQEGGWKRGGKREEGGGTRDEGLRFTGTRWSFRAPPYPMTSEDPIPIVPTIEEIPNYNCKSYSHKRGQGLHKQGRRLTNRMFCSQLRLRETDGTRMGTPRKSRRSCWNNRACLTCRFPLMFDLQISTASAYRPALAEHNERTDSVGRTRSEFHRRIHTVLWMHAAVWSTASAARRMERVSARGRSLYLYG